MSHGQESGGRGADMYSAASSLAWSESPGATSSTYRLERRSRPSSRLPSPATRPPRMRCAVIGAALLTGGAAMLVDVQTVVVSPPPKPSMVHDVSTLATRDRLFKEEADLRAEIQAYASLTDNWDGKGAVCSRKKRICERRFVRQSYRQLGRQGRRRTSRAGRAGCDRISGWQTGRYSSSVAGGGQHRRRGHLLGRRRHIRGGAVRRRRSVLLLCPAQGGERCRGGIRQ